MAPSGLLFEILFVTLGRYWGPLGPKLQKDIKINEKWKPKGRLFVSCVTWRTVNVMLFCCPFSVTILDSFSVVLGKPNVVKV
mgnify:CR=1 FL=1